MSIATVLDALRVPSEFGRVEHIVDDDVLARLDAWKTKAEDELEQLLRDANLNSTGLSVSEQARVVFVAGSFDGEGGWVTKRSLNTSQEILARFNPPSMQLMESVLVNEIKPLFKSNPHPSINVSTGRKLARPAGGPMASQDHFEGQTWKAYPGAGNVVLWCLRHIQDVDYERLWHLVIPPVMTFVDDYEAQYKLSGVGMVSEMLKRVPRDLLRRTGMDGLMLSSLMKCLNWLQNQETPALIRAVVPATVALIRLSTTPGSEQRFNQLCALLGDGIIGSVWMYASENADAVLASIEVLPGVMHELGIGCARYLKAIVVQLVHGLGQARIQIQIRSAEALECVVEVCGPRMRMWKGTIVDGIGRCWVGVVERGEGDPDSVSLKDALRRISYGLKDTAKEELARLVEIDGEMFGGLICSVPAGSCGNGHETSDELNASVGSSDGREA